MEVCHVPTLYLVLDFLVGTWNMSNHLLAKSSPLLSQLAKRFWAAWRMALTRLRHKRFYCRALAGESGYIMSVACDLSLSCNCNDKYGVGKIGDIGSQSLSDILSGEKVSFFRASLARGRLPILNCITCMSLGVSDRKSASRYLHDFRLPTEIMVENTVHCNLKCIACERERIYQNRTKKEMSLSDIQRVADCLKQNQMKKVFYFNYGEPFTSKNLKLELEIIRRENPHIELTTSTNGLLLDREENMEAALCFDHIFFSIHGASRDSLFRYQCGGNFPLSYGNMKRLVAFRNARGKKTPVVEWKYVLFRWNDSPGLLDRAVRLAKEAKVDILSFWPTLCPYYGISYRYFLGWSYFKRIGQPSWKGREIDFRREGTQP